MERLSYNGDLCTVKFKGPIKPWPQQIAYGVEWDDPVRGRNSGDLEGVFYFTCSQPGACSFIKETRKPDACKSFGHAFNEKYLSVFEFEEIKLSKSKTIKTYDVAEMHKFQSNFENLTTITLSHQCINSMHADFSFSLFTNLTKLDLSFNLFEGLKTIANVCSQFPKLSTLFLNGNRFLNFSGCSKVTQIKELNLNNCKINNEDLVQVFNCFENLEVLSLCLNDFDSLPNGLHLLKKLTTLDISLNPKITTLTNLPNSLKELRANGLTINNFDNVDFLPVNVYLNNTDLNYNAIDQIGQLQVRNLTLNDLERRPFIIARCPNLQVLDGTYISNEERIDAEVLVKNMVIANEHPKLNDKVFNNILQKHGGNKSPLEIINSNLMTVVINNETFKVIENAPMYRLGWILKRKFKECDYLQTSDDLIKVNQRMPIGDCLREGMVYKIC